MYVMADIWESAFAAKKLYRIWNVFPALQKASDSGHGLWFAQIKLIYNTLCREMETFLSRALRQ